MLKRYMFAAVGVLALALAFHLGSQSAGAQIGGPFVGITSWSSNSGGTLHSLVAITADGQVWIADRCVGGWCTPPHDPFPSWTLWGMIPTATAVSPSTWGQIKAQGRGR